ncbi:MAG TPA: FKBP-type peptidyl-prolyl cis-trans isomerase [Candidatus Saccharimonadales bacterium]|nr:FKBP-type peptidyl-prolyl cis-trans isomerase [Candidatus Saccharimonadales bacterium]
MTRKRDRFFALVGALLFLVTSAAFTIAVVWQSTHQDNNASATNNTQSNKVQGTKLKDFTPVNTVNQLKITDTKVGTGQVAKDGDTVSVLYTGAVASTGVIFQSTQDTGQPVSLQIKSGSVIEGWAKGIPGMKVGGTRRLLIPAAEAYGANPPAGSGIPANAPLVFDVTLLKVGS